MKAVTQAFENVLFDLRDDVTWLEFVKSAPTRPWYENEEVAWQELSELIEHILALSPSASYLVSNVFLRWKIVDAFLTECDSYRLLYQIYFYPKLLAASKYDMSGMPFVAEQFAKVFNRFSMIRE